MSQKYLIPLKYPSVPDLSTSQQLKKHIYIPSIADSDANLPFTTDLTSNGSLIKEDSTNLSFIELYGDSNDNNDESDDNYMNNQDSESIHSAEILVSLNDSRGLSPESKGQTDIAYDRYGFKKQSQYVTQDEYDEWWNDYSRYCIRRKRKWKAFLQKSGFPIDNDSPSRYPSKSEKLKRYVRKGIPAEWRADAWWYFARGQDILNKNKGVYDKLLTDSKNPKKKQTIESDLEIIERDLNRTFPENIHFQRKKDSQDEPNLIQSLRRVLVAFSLFNKSIGYCQSMNFLVGLLLLFLDEERAFWMLVIITSKYLPNVHNINLEGVNIDQGVLMLCIKEYLPEFWARISPESHQKVVKNKYEFLYKLPPLTLCTASWFMSCFIGVVPIETTLRIWDCLFYEESHVLFKFSLSIIKLSEEEVAKSSRQAKTKEDEDMEIFQTIQSFPKNLLDPNEIFDKIIFKKRIRFNTLNQEEIDRCRKYVSSQRSKFKNFNELVIHKNDSDSTRNSNIEDDTIMETLSSEVYGFKRSLTGVKWNNSIKEKVRQLSRKR